MEREDSRPRAPSPATLAASCVSVVLPTQHEYMQRALTLPKTSSSGWVTSGYWVTAAFTNAEPLPKYRRRQHGAIGLFTLTSKKQHRRKGTHYFPAVLPVRVCLCCLNRQKESRRMSGKISARFVYWILFVVNQGKMNTFEECHEPDLNLNCPTNTKALLTNMCGNLHAAAPFWIVGFKLNLTTFVHLLKNMSGSFLWINYRYCNADKTWEYQ